MELIDNSLPSEPTEHAGKNAKVKVSNAGQIKKVAVESLFERCDVTADVCTE
jgi:hypothetical protein